VLAGDADYVLVVGSETLTRFLDWSDRNTCILFGDGAGAVLVAASHEPGGILSCVLGSDGSHMLKMDGKAVFRFAVQAMADGTREAVAKAGLTLADVDLVIPHQANTRIIQSSVIKQLKIPEQKARRSRRGGCGLVKI